MDQHDTTLGNKPLDTTLEEAAIQEFGAGLRGEVLRPGDDGYEDARKVWNGSINRFPALIVRCAGVADVVNCVNFARDNELLTAVRGGGHSIPGHSMCDGGIVIDLSPMKGIRVDPAARTARAQAGLTWGEFDHETQAFGLATTGGQISTTGIAGLTLGGGIGWLMRKYGLTSDNLLSVDLVTADGMLVTASTEENEDLFWGVRGGGGNFGVVTSFEYRLHPLAPVLGGFVVHRAQKAKELLRFYGDYVATVPDELTTFVVFFTAPPHPPFPEELQGEPVVALAVCYAGSIEDGERVVEPLRQFGSPELDLIGPMTYTVLQSLLDESAPPGLQNHAKSGYLSDLNDEVIDVIVEHAAGMTSPLSQVHIGHMGGAVSQHREGETAFSHRDASFVFLILPFWMDPNESEPHEAWMRKFWAAIQPRTQGVYVNFLDEEGEEGVRAAYGATKRERLVALKNKYDPTNLFRLNQNIKPTAQSGAAF